MTNETRKYDMNHEQRGIALVINVQNYDAPNPFKLEKREWSVKDLENLEKTLNYLEVKVILSVLKKRQKTFEKIGE